VRRDDRPALRMWRAGSGPPTTTARRLTVTLPPPPLPPTLIFLPVRSPAGRPPHIVGTSAGQASRRLSIIFPPANLAARQPRNRYKAPRLVPRHFSREMSHLPAALAIGRVRPSVCLSVPLYLRKPSDLRACIVYGPWAVTIARRG